MREGQGADGVQEQRSGSLGHLSTQDRGAPKLRLQGSLGTPNAHSTVGSHGELECARRWGVGTRQPRCRHATGGLAAPPHASPVSTDGCAFSLEHPL